MPEDEEKHEARREAHEAGIEGASKMTTQDAREATERVRHGEDPQQAKDEVKHD